MNKINDNNTINIQKYYQILQTLGIDKDVSLGELIIIQTEIVNEATQALGKSSFDEAQKKSEMACEAGEILLKWEAVRQSKKVETSNFDNNKNIIKHNSKLEETIKKDKTITDINSNSEKANINQKKLEEIEKRCNLWERLKSTLYQIKNKPVNSGGINDYFIDFFLRKRGIITNFFNANEKIKQLNKDVFSSCAKCTLSSSPHFGDHPIFCLETHQEIEEFSQKVIKNYKEIMVELHRAAMEDEETNKNDNSNHQPTSTSNEKQGNNNQSNNLSSKQKNINQTTPQTNKTTSIDQLKVEIAELKNQNLNAEQKVILATKEAELTKLENETFANDKVNSPKSNLISVILPIGIVLVLAVIPLFWVVRKRRGLKKQK